MGKILFLGPQVVTLNISLPGHFSSWNHNEGNISIDISTAALINRGLYDGVRSLIIYLYWCP